MRVNSASRVPRFAVRSFRTLDRYLLVEWLRVFLITLLGFPILVIVIDLTDKMDTYLSRGLKTGTVALSYVFDLPEKMFLVLPVAVLFATVFTVGALGRHSELTAAKASGISFHRLVRPLFLAGGASFIMGLLLGEIAPVTTSKRLELLGEKAVRSLPTRDNFVYRADRGWVYAIRGLDLRTRQMVDLMLEREGSGVNYPTIVLAGVRCTATATGRRASDPRTGRCIAGRCATSRGTIRVASWRSSSIHWSRARCARVRSTCWLSRRRPTRCAMPS
jgi:lipopolysaccharide export system permease protein